MNKIFLFHDICQICINSPEGEFGDYLNFEFSHGEQIYQLSSDIPTIYIEVDVYLNIVGNIWALGKGLFYNEDSNEILICQDRGTSFYNPQAIYATLSDVTNEDSNTIVIKVKKSNITKKGIDSILKGIHSKIIRGDPRSKDRKNAEIFVSQFVEPNIFRLGLKSNHVLLHVAALSKKKKALMIFGPQNIGKTTIAIGLARRGWRMLGDDLCFIDERGTLRSHHKPLKLEREFLKENADHNTLTALKKEIKMPSIANILHKIVSKNHEIEFKVPASFLGMPLEERSPAASAFFLQRRVSNKNDESVVVERLSYEESVTLCVQHIAAEYDVNKHLDKDIRQNLALYFRNPGSLTMVSPKVSNIISSAFTNISSYMVTMTTPNADVFSSIEDIFLVK